MVIKKSPYLIRDYGNIRKILRDIYIFGCFSRDDFIDMGISGRKYDNEQRRISAYLPEHFIRKRRVNKKVMLYCNYQMENGAENYLAETYRNKSFTMLDIMSYFFVLQLLGAEESMTISELLDALPILNEEVIFTKDNLRVKLEELIEIGLVISQKDGKNVFYLLADDIWKDFSDEELQDIYLYLDYLKNTSPLDVPYYFLQRKIKLYAVLYRNLDLKENTFFQFKHNHLFNSLDNEVLLSVLEAIQQQALLRVKKQAQDGEVEFVTIPIEVVHDTTYGRQYLICYDDKACMMSVIRIDRIIDASVDRVMTNEELILVDEKKAISQTCWCTSGVNREPEKVVIEFMFDEENESYILNRLNREGHQGIIEQIDAGKYIYTNYLRDPEEMIPWIRSFGERAKVISSGSAQIEHKMAAEWKKAMEKYAAL